MPPPLTQFNLATATEADLRALGHFVNLLYHEFDPTEAPLPFEYYQAQWSNIPAFHRVEVWALWDATQTEMLGYCLVQWFLVEDNQHLLDLQLYVGKNYRGQGYGRCLLRAAEPTILATERRLIHVKTRSHIPEGARFAERVGASRGQEISTNQLLLSEFDHGRLEQWLSIPPEIQSSVELGSWDGAYPEEYLNEIVELHHVMNDRPSDNLEVEAFQITAQELRDLEACYTTNGNQRWTMYLRDRGNNALIGFTEVLWHPDRSHLVQQMATGVFPSYRGKGFGRWLKAAMLQRIIAKRPEVQAIRTSNATSNAAMVRINHQLGFKLYEAETIWEIATHQLVEYLKSATAF